MVTLENGWMFLWRSLGWNFAEYIFTVHQGSSSRVPILFHMRDFGSLNWLNPGNYFRDSLLWFKSHLQLTEPKPVKFKNILFYVFSNRYYTEYIYSIKNVKNCIHIGKENVINCLFSYIKYLVGHIITYYYIFMYNFWMCNDSIAIQVLSSNNSLFLRVNIYNRIFISIINQDLWKVWEEKITWQKTWKMIIENLSCDVKRIKFWMQSIYCRSIHRVQS